MRLIFLAIAMFFSISTLRAAVDRSADADSARIELRGTIDRVNNRPVVRAGGSTYLLEFPNSSIREFASSMSGERVIVRGELRTRRLNGSLRMAVRPDFIGREGGSEEVTLNGSAMNVSVDDQFEIAAPTPRTVERPAPALRVENVNTSEVVEDRYYYEEPPPRNRWEKRKRLVRSKSDIRGPGTRVLMTPGGTIILNNQ